MSKPVSPIPPGFHTITPSIIVKGAEAAMALYKKAFGAEEVMCMRGPTGGIMHAEMKIGDSIFMLSDEWPNMGMKAPAPNHISGGLHLYVPDADRAFQRAIEAGCTAVMPPSNMFWGDRYGKVMDSFGHVWGLATHIEDVSPEECARRGAAWKPS
ncbi:MAG: VOC family protein [Phycisphaerae bacterium]